MARTVSRGMILVRGVTYRIERTAPHRYSVVRLLDDVEVGTFRTLPALRVHTCQIDLDTLRDVVRAALRSARTSAVMHAAPVFQPSDASSSSHHANDGTPAFQAEDESPPLAAASGGSVSTVRPPSSAPPPASAMG